MKRVAAIATLFVLCSITSAHGQWWPRGSTAKTIAVSPDGAITKICGGVPTATTYACSADSAMAQIPQGGTDRYQILVYPGNYTGEVITTEGRDRVSIVGVVPYAAVIRPTVTSKTSVYHGVIDIPFNSDDIEIAGLTVWNDAFNLSGAAINIAEDPTTLVSTCTFGACPKNIRIHDNRLVGNETAIRIAGAGPNTGAWPSVFIYDNDIVGGDTGIKRLDLTWSEIYGNRIYVKPDFCTNAATWGGQTGVTLTGTIDTVNGPDVIKIPYSGEPDGLYVGRTVLVSQAGTAGTCPATFNAGTQPLQRRQIIQSVLSSGTYQLAVDRDFGATPTNQCLWTLDGVSENVSGSYAGNMPPMHCTDISWAQMQANSIGNFSAMNGIGILSQPFHGDFDEVSVVMQDRFSVHDNQIFVHMNIGGAHPGYSCQRQAYTAGVAINKMSYLSDIVHNNIEMVINTDIGRMSSTLSRGAGIFCTSGDDCCAQDQVAGILIGGGAGTTHQAQAWTQEQPIQALQNNIRIHNNADADLNIHGVMIEGLINTEFNTLGAAGMPPALDAFGNTVALFSPPIWARKMTSANVTTDATDAIRSLDDAAVTAFPTAAVGDFFMIGVPNKRLTAFTVDVQTAAAGITIVWELMNSSGSWVAFPADAKFNDGTAGLTVDGLISFAPVQATSWGAQDFIGAGAQRGLENAFWIRARISASAAPTNPTINSITVASGKRYELAQYDQAKLRAGDTTAVKKPVQTIGTVTGWTDRCFQYSMDPNAYVATNDNQPIPVSDGDVGLQVAYVGCRCTGTCGAAETVDFEDDAGNQFASAVTCVDNTADMTWTDVRADADALIPAGKSPRFDINTASSVNTDDLTVCLRYSTARFNP